MRLQIAFVAASALALWNCPSPPTELDPVILLSVPTTTFDGLAGGTGPLPRTIAIANGGGGTLSGLQTAISYGAGQPTGWLSLNLSATTAPATITAQVTAPTLAPGTYNATIAVSSSRLLEGTVNLPVTLTLTPGGVISGLSSAAAQLAHTQGLPDPSISFDITNTGAAPLLQLASAVSYPGSGATGWLTATLSAANAPATLELRVMSGQLAPGTHSATVTVSSPYASNGAQTVPVTLNLAAGTVDLVIAMPDTLILPASIEAGQLLTIPTWYVQNVGTLPSPSILLGVYLSDDSIFTDTDLRMRSIRTLPLAPQGGRGGIAETLGIPTAHRGGTYWVGIVADVLNEVVESDESNNVRRAKIVVTPAPAIALDREHVTFDVLAASGIVEQTVAITNGGGGTLDQLLLTVADNPWLTAALDRSTAPATITLRVNTNLPPGQQSQQVWVTSPVASNAKILEVSVHVAARAADLVIQYPQVLTLSASSVVAGQTIDLPAWAVSNRGNGASGPFRAGAFLSSDATITWGADHELAGFYVADLGPADGAAGMTPQTVTIPLTMTPGTYWIGIVADPIEQVAESNESNNVIVATLEITPGPTIAMEPGVFSLETTAGGSELIERSVAISNVGGGTLDQLRVESINYGVGQTITGWLSATLDRTTAPATLRLQVNPYGLPSQQPYGASVIVGSPNAANRSQAVLVMLRVRPSLFVSHASMGFAGSIGGTNPPPQAIELRSRDGGSLGLIRHSILYAEGEPSGWLTATLNAADAPAELLVAASLERLPPTGGELHATIEISASQAGNGPIQVPVLFSVMPAGDLVVSSPTELNVDGITFQAGRELRLPAWTVSNQGEGVTAPFHAGVYLSSDPVFTRDDIALELIEGFPLGRLGWITGQQPLVTIPPETPAGTYWLGIVADAWNETIETNESNNTVAVEITILPRTVLALEPDSLHFEFLAGDYLPPERDIAIRNTGGGTLDGVQSSIEYIGEQPVQWLGTQLMGTTAPTSEHVALHISAATLPAGDYKAAIHVSSPATGASGRVPVTLRVRPAIGVSSRVVEFAATAGGTPPPLRTVTVTGVNGGPLGQLSTVVIGNGGPPSWLNVSLSSSTAPAELVLTPTTTALAAGMYLATVEVHSSEADNSPVGITVVYRVATEPTLSVTPTTVNFHAIAGGTNPAAQQVNVASGGAEAVSGLASAITYGTGQPTGWLTASLSAGETPARLVLNASPGTLAGTYTATVAVAGNAANSPQVVAVSMTVAPLLPDLTLTGPNAGPLTVVPSQVLQGGGVLLSAFTIRNSGNAASGAYDVGIYLSNDATLTASDLRLAGATYASLAAGATNDIAAGTVLVPASVTPGSYHIGVLVDAPGTVAEVSETNNWISTPLAIAVGTPPLAPSNLSSTSPNGSRVDLTWTDNSSNETGFSIQRFVCSTGPLGCLQGTWTSIGSTTANVTTFAVIGIPLGSSWQVRVSAYNAIGSATTGPIYVSAKLAPATGLSATVLAIDQIRLTWVDNETLETGYQVERCTGSACTTFAPVATLGVDAQSYIDAGLGEATTYVYRVRTTGGGAASYSATASATTQASTQLPAAPSGLVATVVSGNRIDLGWVDNASNESGFRLERCQNVGCTVFSQIASPASNTAVYQDTALIGGTSYRYRLRAWNSRGNSSYTTPVLATTLPTPAAPTNLVAVAVNSGTVRLTWTDNASTETGFRVEVCEGTGCTDFRFDRTLAVNATTYDYVDARYSSTYRFRVQATNANGHSSYSNEVLVTTPALEAPSNLVATMNSSGRITLTWTNVAPARAVSGVDIYRCAGVGCSQFTRIGEVGSGMATYVNSGLTPLTSYSYRVQATYAAATSPFSGTVTAVTPAGPAAPTNLIAALPTSSSIQLSWVDNAISGTRIQIERCAGEACTNFALVTGSVLSATEAYTNTGLQSATTYRYRARTTDGDNNSAYTSIASVSTLAAAGAPAQPTALVASVISTSQINLTWVDNATNETGYQLERCAGAACTNFASIVNASVANVTSYQNTGLTAATTYRYRVRMFNATGHSLYSNAVTATTPATPLLVQSPGW